MKISKATFRHETLGDQQRRVSSKKFVRLCEAASAKPGPARPQPLWRAEHTGTT